VFVVRCAVFGPAVFERWDISLKPDFQQPSRYRYQLKNVYQSCACFESPIDKPREWILRLRVSHHVRRARRRASAPTAIVVITSAEMVIVGS
jgi:hypothetical protein